MIAKARGVLAIWQTLENFLHAFASYYSDVEALKHEAASEVIRKADHVFGVENSWQEFENAVNDVLLKTSLTVNYCL